MECGEFSFFLLHWHPLHSLTFEKKKLLVTFAAFVVFFYSLGWSSAGSGLTGNIGIFSVLWIAGGKKQITSKIKRLNGICVVTGAEGCWSMVGRETPC